LSEKTRCHPEEGEGPPRDCINGSRGNEVSGISFAACAGDILIYCIDAFRLHTVPLGGFAAVQDDISNRTARRSA